MQYDNLTHDQIPKALGLLLTKVDNLERKFLTRQTPSEHPKYLTIDELCEYDPAKRSKATFYGYVHRREIAFTKKGKKLLFLKSDIDAWLQSGRRKTGDEISQEADSYIQSR